MGTKHTYYRSPHELDLTMNIWDTTQLDQKYNRRPKGTMYGDRSRPNFGRHGEDSWLFRAREKYLGPERQVMVVEPYCGPRSILIGCVFPCVFICPVDKRKTPLELQH